MFELDSKSNLFIGTSRYVTDNNISLKTGNFYKYKTLKVNLNIAELIDGLDNNIFFNSYFEKEINNKYFLKKGDILVKLVKPIEFFFVIENIDAIFNKSYCVIRSNSYSFEKMTYLWSYLKINEKNISKKLSQQQVISLINIKDIKKIKIDEKVFDDEFLKLFYLKTELKNLLNKKQNLLDKRFEYFIQKKGEY